MQENTNRVIAYNSAILYGRMIITTICALLSTRFALQALGVVDYGLYSVVGGIISLMSIFNTIMLSASNRFLAVAIGKGNEEDVNKQFNVNLSIHAVIALAVLLFSIIIGEWYIPRYINYDGDISKAIVVYYISVFGCVISFVGVPYNGLLMAKEKFIVFSLVEVVVHIIKLYVSWLLISHFENKLIIYSSMMAFTTALVTGVYILYCYRYFDKLVKLCIVRERRLYKQVFGFSAWVSIGAVAQIGKDQGAALVVNNFFNTIMNTAMGIANSINVYIRLFANCVVQPMQPQITKSYAAKNFQRVDELLLMSTKYSFLLVLYAGAVFLIVPDWILKLWLGTVPPYATIFVQLFIIDNLVQSLNMGVGNVVWANGNISLYQLLVSALNMLSVIVGYMVLKTGAEAYYLVVTYILFSVVKFFAIQWSLKKIIHYDNKKLWKESYIPSLKVVILFAPVLLFPEQIHPLIKILISMVYLSFLEFYVGLTKKERQRLNGFLRLSISKSRKDSKEPVD